MLILTGLIMLLTAGCATPNVWVQSVSEQSGVIGYQNYDPNTDNMARIKKLIPCSNFKRTWNGIKSMATGAPSYMYMSNGYGGATAVPLDSGVLQWVEYHYECLPASSNTTSVTLEPIEKD